MITLIVLWLLVFRVSSSKCCGVACICDIYWPRGFKTFSMLNSFEHEISTAHKNYFKLGNFCENLYNIALKDKFATYQIRY